MSSPAYVSAIEYALDRLERELSAEFIYHNIAHTRDHVMPAAERLARMSNCSEDDINLLRVAAAFHDLGFVETNKNHEITGARLAAQRLPAYGFSPSDIDRVIGIILATRIPQSPTTLLEQIMADADLDVLGRADFLNRNNALRTELAALGNPVSDIDWFASQVNFIENHTYWTAAAREWHERGKKANIAAIRAQLARVTR
jgi:uncharacterized protein